MVFFTCNVCNESLKKNQVEKHYLQKCRQCEFLSCVDCGKDFWGDSYQSHIKCISEEEKYSGKNYVAKVNKGEVKQEQWIQKVQSAIQKAQANPQLRNVLQRLEEFPNVPRKKAKFENFLKCSLRVYNTGLCSQVWDLLMAEAQPQSDSNTQAANGGEDKTHTDSSQSGAAQEADVPEQKEVNGEGTEKKLSKRERKEERRKKSHKPEKKDKHGEDGGVADEDDEKSKKKRKRKKRDDDDDGEDDDVEIEPKKKKKREENGTKEEKNILPENGTEDQDDAELAEAKPGKFNWGATITAVLESKGEISIKKLQKKVLAEYASYGSSKPEEKVQAKFNKKLTKMPNVKVLQDRARLIQS